MPKRVLVPLDESEQARRALDEAIDLFPGATLVLLNVFSRGPADAPTTDGNEELSELEARRHEMLASAMEGRNHDGPVETVVEFGNPAPAIVDYAEENGVDHVVVGSHAGGEISEIVVGSVAEEVVDKSPVSVRRSFPGSTLPGPRPAGTVSARLPQSSSSSSSSRISSSRPMSSSWLASDSNVISPSWSFSWTVTASSSSMSAFWSFCSDSS